MVRAASLRLQRTVGHLIEQRDDHQQVSSYTSTVRWNGWGFGDTSMVVNADGILEVTGDRYPFSGTILPHFRSWAETSIGLDIECESFSQDRSELVLPPPIRNSEFITAVESRCVMLTFHDDERLLHSHGHTCQDIWSLRYGGFERYVDVVIYPGSHRDVEEIIQAAREHNVVIIPYGGGTTVSAGLECPKDEKRMIASVDLHEMNRIRWIDRKNMTALIEAGAIGREIEEKLNQQGLTMGHEPDSSEFSTLGGWISTRASGMMKNKYGNIEDIVIQITLVTPTGLFKRRSLGPRVSIGPDLNEFVLGSEGTLGIITEAVVKVHVLPEITKFGSVIFPEFELGVRFLHEVARRRCAPVSVRLVDNQQFQFGQALKPPTLSNSQYVVDKLKKWYVTKALRFDPARMVVATLKFIGNAKEIARQESEVFAVAKEYSGRSAGEENGKRGYFLTFMIAYIRDFAFDYNFMAESFETAVPWSHCLSLCRKVKEQISISCEKHSVHGRPFVSCRVTQTYDAGACVYFYFGFLFNGLPNPIEVFSQIEHEARVCILENHGSLSHHHGVGKHRKSFMEHSVSATGVIMLKAVKQALDPTNIFANGNLI
uniref:Alkylglycerone-phosphate synthase n=1 Tax=Hirondellea gigas TaxID=1518452 RepID=A0A6A7G5F9_9CRUS